MLRPHVAAQSTAGMRSRNSPTPRPLQQRDVKHAVLQCVWHRDSKEILQNTCLLPLAAKRKDWHSHACALPLPRELRVWIHHNSSSSSSSEAGRQAGCKPLTNTRQLCTDTTVYLHDSIRDSDSGGGATAPSCHRLRHHAVWPLLPVHIITGASLIFTHRRSKVPNTRQATTLVSILCVDNRACLARTCS